MRDGCHQIPAAEHSRDLSVPREDEAAAPPCPTHEAPSSNSDLLVSHVLASLRDGITLVDREFTVHSTNPAMERLFPHHAPPLIGKTCHRVYHNRELPCEWCPTHRAMPAGDAEPTTVTVRSVSKGKSTWLDCYCVAQHDPTTGVLTGFIGHFHDITAHKHVEHDLERERAYLSSAIDILPLPLLFMSTKNPTIRMNKAMREFLRADRRWKLQTVRMLDPDTRMPLPNEQRPEIRALAGEVIPTFEAIIALPGGREIPIIGHAAPVFVAGKQVAAVTAYQDISALKEADRAKDKFLAILSHELLTPLTSILGWAQAANGSPDLDILNRSLAIIERNAVRQRRIVDDLLDMSRIIYGKMTLRKETVDLWNLIEQTVESMQQVADDRNVSLVFGARPIGEMPILADAVRLQQVFSNLLNNALKFTPSGGSITVSGYHQESDVTITIQDSGIGIPTEQLPHIFKPFHQIEGSGVPGGLGLGLALVKGIVDLHGGAISAQSDAPNQGSLFTVSIPRIINQQYGD